MASEVAAPSPTLAHLLTLATALVVVVPMNLAFSIAPSATVLNQAAAWLGWGAVASLLASQSIDSPRLAELCAGARALVVALSLLACAALVSPLWSGLPPGMALSIAATLLAALVLVYAGVAAARDGFGQASIGAALARAACVALLLAGALASVIGIVQVFAPALADGEWIASSSIEGRASGNLRQPNHLASLLLWSMIAAAGWAESAADGQRGRVAAALLIALLLLFGVVLTASRTGVAGVLLLALWGSCDRGLASRTRVALLLAPLAYTAMWLALVGTSAGGDASFSGAERLAQADPSSARLAIWANTLALIAHHPLAGVGVGEFNFAWTLTRFPDRPLQFFDHAHNLPLQLLVELGLPLGALVLALLAFALWRALPRRRPAGERAASPASRCAFMIVLMAALHSQFEYPLWYAHFLFPVALAWGVCLGTATPSAERQRPRVRIFVVASLAMLGAAAVLLADYSRVTAIFAAADDAPPLAERIGAGRRSLFFSHHADYALVTSAGEPGRVLEAFAEPVHYLLDTRLMIAWSKALAANGSLDLAVDRARWLAARLAEFHHPDAAGFFAPCAAATTQQPQPFQCQPPQRSYSFKDFR